MKLCPLKLKRVESGDYMTQDGRFRIRNTYYSSELPGRTGGAKGWLIEDMSGARPFLVSSTQRSKLRRVDSLGMARELVAGIIRWDAQASRLIKAGWIKFDNLEQPGVCWQSPTSGIWLTQTEAIIQLDKQEEEICC